MQVNEKEIQIQIYWLLDIDEYTSFNTFIRKNNLIINNNNKKKLFIDITKGRDSYCPR